MGVARNVVNPEFRRATKHRAVTRRISARELVDSDSLADIEHRIDAERAAREVYEAVTRLPRRDRALVEPSAAKSAPAIGWPAGCGAPA